VGIIGGWCRYYQTTSSPSYYFNGLNKVLFEAMTHWLGRKYRTRISEAMRRFKKGHTFGTDRITLQMPLEFKAKRHRLRAIKNPYTAKDTRIQRENLDGLGEEWDGTEWRKGQEDRKEVVYQRDKGLCGICGNFVPWDEAILDHKVPRHLFNPPESGDQWENLHILHSDPCDLMKTKRDRQGGRRVR
jgi:hypothetical protein